MVPSLRWCLRRSVAVAGFAAWLSVPASANLLVNGSFDTGPDPGMATQLPVGSTAIAGWQVTRNPIDYVGTRWENQNGPCSVGLNGVSPGGIAQTFATDVGAEYLVTYYLAGDSFTATLIKHLRVTAAGQSADETFDTTHSWPWGMGWVQRTFSFTAVASSTTLEFYSLDAGDSGPAVDNVSMILVTPAAVGAGGAGLALGAPWPNPARGGVHVDWTLPADAPVRLAIHDLQGREVAVLADGEASAGRHEARWDGRAGAAAAAPGIYFVRLVTPGATLARRVAIAD